jgi:two-component system sensor histidine kinase RpfC
MPDIALRDRFRALRAKLHARPDTEHEQALIRVLIAPMMVVYLYMALRFGQIGPTAFDGVVFAIVAEMLVAIALLGLIVWKPGVSHVCRIVGMVTDYGTSGLAMVLIGEAGAPFAALYLWMTIGNGHRFGPRYLRLAIAMAAVGFAIVILLTPYWREHLLLSSSLLLAMVAVPAYQERLISALIEAKEESARASRAKTWFLASTSHELRTPLTGVIGMIDALEATPLRDDQATYLRVARASARSLLALVHDVLDISAIEAGRLTVTKVDFSLREMLADLETMLGTNAVQKGLQFELDVQPDVRDALHADRDHLRQILVNLIANAVKFTDAGSVRVRVRRANDDGSELHFEVADTGIGIPEHAKSKIFEAFAQAHTGRDRRFGGTGLGTTIARELTAQLGGRIGFESQEGRGSTFWVVLPVEAANDGVPQEKPRSVKELIAAHRAGWQGLEVLVVDDQPTNRLVIREVLTQAGHHVHEADGGEAALELLAGHRFDLVISDFHMPGLTGLDMLKELRVMQAGEPPTPFILLTADLTHDAREHADAAGVSAFLSKPVDSVRLLHAIEGAMGNGPPPPSNVISLEARRRAAAPVPAVPQEETIDPVVLQELAEASSNASFLTGFVRGSLDDARIAVAALEAAGGRGDWDDFRDRAHAIKGITANIGAVRVAALAGAAMRRDTFGLTASWQADCAEIRRALDAAEDRVGAVLATLVLP